MSPLVLQLREAPDTGIDMSPVNPARFAASEPREWLRVPLQVGGDATHSPNSSNWMVRMHDTSSCAGQSNTCIVSARTWAQVR